MDINTATPPLSAYIAAELRAEMSRQGRTVSEVALAAGWNRKTLGDSLRGKRAMTADEIETVAAVLDVDTLSVIKPAEARRESGRTVA